MQLTGLTTFAPNTLIQSAQVNSNFSSVATVLNGNLGTDNFGTLSGAFTWTITSNVLCLSATTSSNLGAASFVQNAAITSARSVFYIGSTAAQTAGDAGFHVDFSNASSTVPLAYFTNSGTGPAMSLVQSGILAASQAGISLTSNAAQTLGTAGLLVNFSSGSSTIPLIQTSNSGTGYNVVHADGSGTMRMRVGKAGLEVLNQTDTQLAAISSPNEGSIAYSTTQHRHQRYNGLSWESLGAPAGMFVPFAGFTAPAGWLLCDGTAYSRTTYAALFAAISIQITGTTTNSSTSVTGITSTTGIQVGMPISGTNIQAGTTVASVAANSLTLSQNASGSGSVTLTVAPYGVGDGSTTFNVPDMRGTTPIGAGQGTYSGASSRILGQFAGEETHTLSTPELPAHNHPVSISNHSHYTYYSSGGASGTGETLINSNSIQMFLGSANSTDAGAAISPHSASIGNTGSGTAHNNMQPSRAANFIIKY